MDLIRGGGIALLVDVADGARITSLTAGGREWLAPTGPRYGGGFVQAGSGGWDEAIPTVAACVLPDGTVLADHGDAWSMPWTVSSRGAESVVATVRLRSVPVTVTRRIAGSAAGIRIDYEATTSSVEALPLLWAAHPLFAADDATRVVVGDGSGSGGGGDRGADPALALVEEYPQRGRELAWDPQRRAETSALKAFVAGTHSSARVTHGDGQSLRLGWDAADLPYLGLYWDGAEFTDTPVVAIEPSTGWGDSAARAVASGRVRTVSAAEPLRWWLTLTHEG